MQTSKMKYPYIPDLDMFYQFYDKLLSSTDTNNSVSENSYADFFVQKEFVKLINGHYVISDQVDLTDNENRDEHLLDYLLEWQDVKEVCNFIGDKGKDLDRIQCHFQNRYNSDNILVIIAWLERLKYIINRGDKYIINTSISEDDDAEATSIYPLSYKQTVDIQEDKYSVYEYLRKIRRGLVVMNPDFQRNLVWKNEQKSKFVESTIMQIPIPSFYLKKTEDNKYIIIDGLQRTSALMDFADNKLKLCGLNALASLNGKDIESLNKIDPVISTRFEDKQLSFYILQPTVPMSIIYDIFNRINTGGTKLERQEIRNCIFIGKATKLLKDIADTSEFKQSIDNGISDTRMKAREAILRCIAFVILPIESYQGSLDEYLEKALRKLNRLTDDEINNLQAKIIDTFVRTYNVFGNKNFRIPDKNNRGRINIAVMEAIFNCFWNSPEISDDKDKVFMNYNDLLNNSSFLKSVRASTGTKSNVLERFSRANEYLNK